MARKSLLASAALLAFGAGSIAAIPAQAQDIEAGVNARVQVAANDDENGNGRRGGWRNRDGGGSMQSAPERGWRAEQRGGDAGAEQRAQARAEWQQQRAQAQAQVDTQEAPRRNAPEGGWRSQRPDNGERYGRNWDNGAVSRPAPAWRGATPSIPDRGVTEQPTAERWGDRNRTYSDPGRNGSYRKGYRDGRTADSWRDRAQQRDAYRDGYHQGQTADNWRDRTDRNRAWNNGYTTGTRDWSRNRYSGDYRQWNRNDWRRDRRYDWYGYRTHNREVYRVGRYYSPYRNWSYNRLRIGIFLQPLFYSRSYWIDDPWQYRLPDAYGPYRWVRYYDDALLVDIYSGEVVDVIYDFFW